MLGICLREHHQLDIRRIPAEILIGHAEVVDLVYGQRETQARIGIRKGRRSVVTQTDDLQRSRRGFLRQHAEVLIEQHGFGHAVMECGGNRVAQSRRARAGQVPAHPALDPGHRR